MDVAASLPLAFGAAVGSGLNLYATVLALGGMHELGLIALPPDLRILGSPMVMGVAFAAYGAEFLADKIPGIDHLWDLFQTFLRIPGGALLAAGAVGGADAGLGQEALTAAALVAGGTLAAGTHAAKAAGRVGINASPMIFLAWLVSLVEDGLAVAAVWLAYSKPWILAVLAVLAGLLLVWLAPKLWRGLEWLARGLRHPLETLRAGRRHPPAWTNPPPANGGSAP
jgi:hypothetical protein